MGVVDTISRRQNRGRRNAKAAILTAAMTEFGSKGYHGGSMRAIARASHMHLVQLQHYFGGKLALWRAAREAAVASYREDLTIHLSAAGERQPVQDLILAIDHLIRFAALHPETIRLIHQSAADKEVSADRYSVAAGEWCFRLIADLMAAVNARADTSIRADTPAAIQIVGAALYPFLNGLSLSTAEVNQHIRVCTALVVRDASELAPPPLAVVAPDTADREIGPTVFGLIWHSSVIITNGWLRHMAGWEMSRVQLSMLEVLARNPVVTPTRLASWLAISPRSARATLRLLEGKGYITVQSAPYSRRVLSATVSREGLELLERLHLLFPVVEREMLSTLTPEECLALQSALTRIVSQHHPQALKRGFPLRQWVVGNGV